MRAVIGVIVPLDGGVVSREEIVHLAGRARLPSIRTPSLVEDGGIALLSIAATGRSTPSSPSERKSPALRSDRFLAIADGTLDNRAELAEELGLAQFPGVPVSAESVLAAAYERWGADCPSHLVGELAFVLWDKRDRRLLASRDALGSRELFYRRMGNRLVIASQLQMLLRDPSASDLDEEYVADFLAKQFFYGESTPFKSISRIQAGHSLEFADGQVTIRRFWSAADYFDGASSSHHPGVEEFLDLLREGVERCLATADRTWAELSGGLDSSSVVCLANELVQTGKARGTDVGTLTLTYDATPQSDEREWSRAVVEHCGLRNIEIPCDDRFFEGMEEAALYRNEPHFGILCHPMFEAETNALRAAGVGALLSGARAESIVGHDSMPPVHLADYLRQLRITAFFRDLRRWQQATRIPLTNLVLKFALLPLVKPGVFYSSNEDRGEIDRWIHKGFARRMQVQDRARLVHTSKRFPSRAAQATAEKLAHSEQMISRGLIEWSCELRHPFLYRPLVELALKIPWEEKVVPDMGKPLLRRAMEGRLPDKVRTRRGGRGPGPAGYKAYAARWSSIEPVVRSSLLVELGYLDREEFYRAAELVRFGAATKYGAFTSCLAFEYWLRSVLGHSDRARSAGSASGA